MTFFKSSCNYRSYIYSSKDAIFFGNLDLGERVDVSTLPRTRPRVRFQGQVLNFSYYRSDDFGMIPSFPKRNLIRRCGSFLNTQEWFPHLHFTHTGYFSISWNEYRLWLKIVIVRAQLAKEIIQIHKFLSTECTTRTVDFRFLLFNILARSHGAMFDQGDIGGFWIPQNRKKNWQIPHYRKKIRQIPQYR